MHKLKETVEFTYQGIKVYVKIDYINNKISIVEPVKHYPGKFQRKQYLFNERGVEYMNGWLNILDAMKYAITEAKKMYEAQLEETSRLNMEEIVQIAGLSK